MNKVKKVTVILYPEQEGGYAAFIPMFPECTTQGETVEEALANAKESLELTLEVPTEDDLERVDLLNVDHVVVSQIEVEVPTGEVATSTVTSKR